MSSEDGENPPPSRDLLSEFLVLPKPSMEQKVKPKLVARVLTSQENLQILQEKERARKDIEDLKRKIKEERERKAKEREKIRKEKEDKRKEKEKKRGRREQDCNKKMKRTAAGGKRRMTA